MAGTIKGIIVEIGGDTSGLQKALKNVNSATSSLSKELRGVNSLLKLDPSNTELVAQKQTILAKNIQETSEKLELLKSTQKQAEEAMANGTEISEENYRNLRREIINTENKLKELQLEASDWTKVGRELEEFGNKVTNISSKIDNLGSTLTTTLTLPVLAIGTAAVTTGNSFEAQMSRVQAIAGATKDELEQLTDQAIDLGAETTFSASEVAAGMENLASAGFTVQEIMDAMPGLLNLAASSGAELATSSEIAASAIRGFGLEASQSAHVADVFAEAAARTNAQTEDMGNAMKYIAPVANTMGLSLEEVAAAIGIMSDAGIKGEQAGTTLRGALTRLTKPTNKMITVMEELGISFYDNEGKMKSLTEIVSMLQDATKDLTDEQEQNALTTLFGTESLSGMVALINRGSDELDEMTKSFEDCDGSAEDMADTMLDNTSGALESLSGSFESAGIAIQKALAPEIKDLAKWIQDLVDDFNNLTDEEKQNIIKTAALVATIGPAIKILSKLSGGAGATIKRIGTLTQAIDVMTTGATSSNSTVNTLAKLISGLTSPTSLAVIGFAGLTASLYAYEKSIWSVAEDADKLKIAVENQIQSRNELISVQNKNLSANLSEMDNLQSLRDELTLLVDENGKVKEGYENRVNFILNELNSALGTEYDLNEDIISGYKELQDNIDLTIKKKKAEIIIDAEKEAYANAIENQAEAYDTLNDLLEKQKDLQIEIGHTTGSQQAAAKTALMKVNIAIEEQNGLIEGYANDIARYEADSAAVISGSEEEIQKVIDRTTYSYVDSTATIDTQVNQQIQTEVSKLNTYRKLYNEQVKANNTANAEIYQSQINAQNSTLENLATTLANATTEVNMLTPDLTEAWKTLATSNVSAYQAALSQVSPEIQKKIGEATGLVYIDTSLDDAFSRLGSRNVTAYSNEINSISDKASDEIVATKGLIDADTTMYSSGLLLGDNIYNGFVASDMNSSLLWKLAQKNAKSYLSGFSSKLEINSPSKEFKKLGNFSKEGFEEGNNSEDYKNMAAKNAEAYIDGFSLLTKSLANQTNKNLSNSFNFKIPNMNNVNKELKKQTKMIYTTPTLNIYTQGEVNVRKIADEVNRIFGSKY